MRGNSERLRTSNYTDNGYVHRKLVIRTYGLGRLLNRRSHRVWCVLLFPLTFKGAFMRKASLALSVLAGLAGGTTIPAGAAPLAHGLLPSIEALLPVVNTVPDAVVNEGASVQTVQYYRRYRRYGRHSYHNRRYSRRY